MELLRLAFDTMNTNQRHEVFGEIITEIPPSLVEGNKLQITIERFYEKSLAGHHYAPFDINSKNFLDIPEETDAWFDEISDHLEDCSKLSDQGDHDIAVQCFKLLHELIDKMEDGDEIIFADSELKRQAIANAYPNIVDSNLPDWSEDAALLDWLSNLK